MRSATVKHGCANLRMQYRDRLRRSPGELRVTLWHAYSHLLYDRHE